MDKQDHQKQSLLPQEMKTFSVAVHNHPPVNNKTSIRNHLSRISHLSVHNFNTALFYIRETWKSGMTQALLNMPFVLNAANNSGGDPSFGVSSAFIGAFVNGFFSGSNHSIYAPTWVTAGYNYNIVQEYGFEAVPWVTIIIGLSIYLISQFKWHHLIDFMPNFVIEGFYLGLGFIILNAYIDYAFGLTDMHSNRGITVYSDRIEMYTEYFKRGDMMHFAVTWLVFLYLYLGNKYNSQFPWILTTSFAGLVIGAIYPNERCLHSIYGPATIKFEPIEANGQKFEPSFQTISYLIVYSIPMTFYITIQNLICARGAETLSGVKCDNDKEIICVSIANIVCGIFGCLPCCASIRLFALNIKVRTSNQWSSILNAASILIFYGLCSKIFLEIPLYIVSAHILFCAYQCPTWPYLEMLYRTRRRMVLLKVVIIALLCVYYGALQSTIIGSMYAMLQFAEKMSAAASEIIVQQDDMQSGKESIEYKHSMLKRVAGEVLDSRKEITQHHQDDLPDSSFKGSYSLYRFNGSINYINIKNHIKQIKQLPDTDYIVLSFRYVSVFDDESIDKLAILIKNMIGSGREILITGLHKGMIVEMSYNEYLKNYFKRYKNKIKSLGQSVQDV